MPALASHFLAMSDRLVPLAASAFISMRSSVVSFAETASRVFLICVVLLGRFDQRNDVLRGEQVLVILEGDKMVGVQTWIGAEQVARLNLAVGQRRHRQRAARIEADEVLEVEAVHVAQADHALRPRLPFRRAAEHQFAGVPASDPRSSSACTCRRWPVSPRRHPCPPRETGSASDAGW